MSKATGSVRPMSFGWSRTRIGGRQLILRLRGFIVQVRFVWGTPWDEYVTSREFTVRRCKYGWMGFHRLGKPYLRWQAQWFPADRHAARTGVRRA